MDQEAASLSSAIGARVKHERQTRRWTLDRLAEATGVSRRMIINVEQGAANPSIATHCPYCALQCGVLFADGRVDGNAEFPVNRGALCVKGWTSGELLGHPERLDQRNRHLVAERRRVRQPRARHLGRDALRECKLRNGVRRLHRRSVGRGHAHDDRDDGSGQHVVGARHADAARGRDVGVAVEQGLRLQHRQHGPLLDLPLHPDGQHRLRTFADQLSELPGVDSDRVQSFSRVLSQSRLPFMVRRKQLLFDFAKGVLLGDDQTTTAIVVPLADHEKSKVTTTQAIEGIRRLAGFECQALRRNPSPGFSGRYARVRKDK